MQDQLPSSLVIPAGTDYPEAPTLCAASLSDASTKGAVPPPGHAQSEVGKGRHSHSDPELDDFTREQAIARAAALVEFFHAEAGLYEALWRAHSDFGHKAAYDLAYSNAHKARELMESLVKGRSARQVAKLERERGLDLPACANEERAR